MRFLNYAFVLLPSMLWAQELTVIDYATAFDDLHAFKEKFFNTYPLKPETEPQEITLVELDYILYQTNSIEAPYILISDEAISIGLSNELALNLRDDFLNYFDENCSSGLNYSPEIGSFTEWNCGSAKLSMIQEKQLTMLYIRKEE